ncbi:MAG: hypothetical protein U9M95_01615 [Candidatus Altiarchaeota archaeon]|nr:hypothetical protein [Candidatus Altiarchaeota archaeon]
MKTKGVWDISKMALVLFTVLFLTMMHTIYVEYSRMLLSHHLMEEADSIAHIIDSMQVCPGNCTLKYRLPTSLSGHPYMVRVCGNSVLLDAGTYSGSSIRVNESLINGVVNSLDLGGGDVLEIKKSFYSKLEVGKG